MNAMMIAGITFLFITGNLFSFMIEGSSGLAVTSLSAGITSSALFIPIENSNGFQSSDSRIFVGSEEVAYSSIQTTNDGNCTGDVNPCLVVDSGSRGINGSGATKHNAGTRVYSESAGLLNTVVGFRMQEFASLNTVEKVLRAPIFFIGAIANFAAKVVLWDYSFLEGNAVYIKYTLLYPLSVAFVFAFIMFIRKVVSG